jgi:hypothetical protein
MVTLSKAALSSAFYNKTFRNAFHNVIRENDRNLALIFVPYFLILKFEMLSRLSLTDGCR